GCTARPAASDIAEEPRCGAVTPGQVTWTSVTRSVWPDTVRVQGNIQADEEAVVGAKTSGRIARTLVDLGTTVQAGDPLAELEMEDFDLQLRQAEAQLAEACAAVGLEPEDSLDELDPLQVPTVLLEKAVMEEARQNLLRLQTLRESNAIAQSELDQQ